MVKILRPRDFVITARLSPHGTVITYRRRATNAHASKDTRAATLPHSDAARRTALDPHRRLRETRTRRVGVLEFFHATSQHRPTDPPPNHFFFVSVRG